MSTSTYSGPRPLKLDDLNFDIVTGLRTALDDDAIEAYLKDWEKLPPIEVYTDGTTNWVVDGGHRGAAGRLGGKKTIKCMVRSGTRREAEIEAMGKNEHHGVRRSNEEKRMIVERLLDDPEWGKRSGRWIAEVARVDPKTVRNIKGERSGGDEPTGDRPQLKVEGKDGKSRPAVGKRKSKVEEVAATESEAWDCMVCGKENGPNVKECEHEGLDAADSDEGLEPLGATLTTKEVETLNAGPPIAVKPVPVDENLHPVPDDSVTHPTVVSGRPIRRPSPAPGTPTVFSSPFVFGYEHEGRRRLELIKSALMIGVDGAWVGFDLAFLTDEEFVRLVRGMQETRA